MKEKKIRKKPAAWRTFRRLASVFLCALLIFAALPLPVRAAGPNHAVIHIFHAGSSGSVTESIYEYDGASRLVCIGNRGTAIGDYFASGGCSYSFYVLKSDGLGVTAPSVTFVKSRTYVSDGTVTETPGRGGITTLTGASRSTVRYYGYTHDSVYIEGNYGFVSYNSSLREVSETSGKNTVSPSDLAYHYLKTGSLLSGCNAYFSSWNSGSLLFATTQNTPTTSDFSILMPSLQDGAFTSGGIVYAGEAIWGGIQVNFTYDNGGGTLYYKYMLPMGASTYSLNLSGIQNMTIAGKVCTLSSITLRPAVQLSHKSSIILGSPISYSSSQLEAAGCFGKGGNPLVMAGKPGTDKDPSGSGTVDPWDSDNGAGSGDVSGGNHKGDSELPPDIDTDGTEGGFWGNVLKFLRNIAVNIANLPANIGASLAGLMVPVVEKLSALSLDIAGLGGDVTASIAAQGKEVVDSVEGLGLSIAEKGAGIVDAVESLGEDIAGLGIDISLSVAEQGKEIVDSVGELGLSVAAQGKDIVDTVSGLGKDVAALGLDLMQKGAELVAGVAGLGVDIAKTGKDIIDSIIGLPLSIASLLVPREGYLDKYHAEFETRFPIVTEGKAVMQEAARRFGIMGQEAPYITVPFSRGGGGKWGSDLEISFAWFAPFRKDFHTLVSVFMWGIFAFRQYFGIKHIFNATSSVPAGFVSSLRGD